MLIGQTAADNGTNGQHGEGRTCSLTERGQRTNTWTSRHGERRTFILARRGWTVGLTYRTETEKEDMQVDRERIDRQSDTHDREKERQEDTVCMQLDRERIDSRTLRKTETGDRKMLYAYRLTERG